MVLSGVLFFLTAENEVEIIRLIKKSNQYDDILPPKISFAVIFHHKKVNNSLSLRSEESIKKEANRPYKGPEKSGFCKEQSRSPSFQLDDSKKRIQ